MKSAILRTSLQLLQGTAESRLHHTAFIRDKHCWGLPSLLISFATGHWQVLVDKAQPDACVCGRQASLAQIGRVMEAAQVALAPVTEDGHLHLPPGVSRHRK